MSDFEILKKSLEGNMARIQQLLDREGIEEKFRKDRWYSSNRENAELRHRLKILRKDSILLEKVVGR